MFLLICLLLGLCGLGLSFLISRTLISPLGLYSLVWATLVLLHHIISASNPDLYYALDSQTELIVWLAWATWIVGCLLGSIRSRRSAGPPVWEARLSQARLRLVLILLNAFSAVSVAASLWKLAITGMLLQPGDAWREVHFIPTRDVFARGLIYDLVIVFSLAATYASASLGLYAVLRHRFPVVFVIVPFGLGLAYDLSIVGRYWITQAPVLAAVAYFLYARLPSSAPPTPERGMAPSPPSRVPHSQSQKKKLSPLRTLAIVAAGTMLGLSIVAQLRTGVKLMNERGLNIGPVETTNVLVGPILYVTDTLGLLNAYVSSQHNWKTTDGTLFAGGLFYFLNIPSQKVFKSDLGSQVLSYTRESDELLPIGYKRNGQFFTSYLVPATADFGFLGIFIYPLLAGFIFTKVYQSAVGGRRLLTTALYPLVAIWVVFTVMRWELIGATPWIATGYLLIAEWWMLPRRNQ